MSTILYFNRGFLPAPEVTLEKQINVLEEAVIERARDNDEYRALLSITGVGKVLGFTILLETGDIRRFTGR